MKVRELLIKMKYAIIAFLTSNRVKSFLWRSGMMLAAYAVNTLIQGLTSYGLSPAEITVAGLILGEISKAINKSLTEANAKQ